MSVKVASMVSFGALIIAVMIEPGHLGSLVSRTPDMIVFVGTKELHDRISDQ